MKFDRNQKQVDIKQGSSPLILSMPHTGVEVPDDIFSRLNAAGQKLADTDWNVDQLYDGLVSDATLVRALFHRYVLDANRSPADESLYPGQNTTGLCPLTDFTGAPIYQPGCEPDAGEIEKRREDYHQPYHAALASEIDRVQKQYGIAIVCDCHSIRPELPFLFEGSLPDINIGTNSQKSCAQAFEQTVMEICSANQNYSTVLNARFKGGWTTRHYADLARNVHVVQIELAQSTYMQELPPWHYQPEMACNLRQLLRRILLGLQQTSFKIIDQNSFQTSSQTSSQPTDGALSHD